MCVKKVKHTGADTYKCRTSPGLGWPLVLSEDGTSDSDLIAYWGGRPAQRRINICGGGYTNLKKVLSQATEEHAASLVRMSSEVAATSRSLCWFRVNRIEY